MSFTDLANVAQQWPQQRQQPQPPQPGQPPDPTQQPPDPRSFSLSPTNPASRAFQQTAGIPGVDPTRDPNEAAALENTGVAEKKTDEDQGFQPPVFAPAIYRRPTDNRGASGWGQDWNPVTMALAYPGVSPGPDLPSPKEAYPETVQAGNYLSRFGSPDVAGPAQEASLLASPLAALLDAFSQGKFSRNYTVAALRGIQIRQAQMMQAQEQTLAAHQQFLMGAGTIFNKISFGDPATVAAAEQELRDYLIQHNHQYLLGMLNNHDIRGVANALDVEDQQFRRMMAANTQLRKATQGVQEEERAAAAYGHAAGGTGAFGGLNLPGRGGQQAQAPTVDDAALSDADKEIMARSPGQLTPQDMAAAHRRLMGQNDIFPIPTGGETDYRIAQQHAALDQLVRDVQNYQNPDPNLSPQQRAAEKINMLGRIDRNLPGIMQGLTTYRVDPKSEEGKRWVQLAQSIDPRYDPGNFANAHKWFDQNSAERKVIGRVGNVTQSTLTLLDNLKGFDENGSVVQNKLAQWSAGLLGNDDKYKIAFDAIMDLDSHFNAIANYTGTPRVTTLMKQIENLGSAATPLQVRGVVMVNLRSAYQVFHDYQADFSKDTNREELLPGANPHNMRVFRDLIRMNTKTGEVPADAQPEVQAVGRDPSKQGTRSGLSDTERLPPLTMDAIWRLADKQKELAASDDPELQAQAHEILQRIGPVIGITERIPGVDPDATRPGSRPAAVRQGR